jgi:ankyrin repeat protein
LASAEFQTFLDFDKQTLFCPGIPGAGKTILTSIVVDNLGKRYSNNITIGIAYIYCNFRRQGEQKADNLLANLLKQLAQRQPSLPNSVKDLYNQHQIRKTRPSLEEISRALQSVAAMYSRIFVIVDALDECQVSDGCRQRFLLGLFDLQAKCGANLFVTSRPISSIEKEFEGNIILEIRASEEDMRRYLEGHMFRLSGFVVRSLELQEEIKTEIVKAVDGMYVVYFEYEPNHANSARFLLAQLYLESLTGKRSPKAIRTSLKNLATGSGAYDHAYEDAMERISGQVKDQEVLAKQVLSWITCAKRPLITTELQHALGVEVGESELDEDNFSQIEDIVSVCAGLVTVDEESNIIRLIHYTTQEYFERTRGILFPNAEADITTTCITYLSFSIFDSGFCQRDEDLEERLRDNPLYEYAARNWGRHALEASQTEGLIMNFFGSEVKLEASVQAMLAFNEGLFHACCAEYEPRNMTGLHLGAYFGLKETIESLLMTSSDPDLEDSFGRTPLSWAAQRGHIVVVQQLLGKGAEADPVDTFGRTPLSWAAENGHVQVVQKLLEEGANPDLKDGNNDITPLSHAAFNRHVAMVQLLILEGADPEAEDRDGRTPLSWAAECGQSEVIQELFENGADPESVDNDGRTPLSCAAFGGNEGVVRLLLEKGVDVESKDNNGQTPLSWAARKGREAVV